MPLLRFARKGSFIPAQLPTLLGRMQFADLQIAVEAVSWPWPICGYMALQAGCPSTFLDPRNLPWNCWTRD